ncbi:hypothetical protein HPB50_017809 [Hyalomma asiaticum]|uniref:Uncharacterized protein n=1 Tax=Hyalomma asiaticum TaxID=266040 RepID=A0ACB7RVA1_HYAAI|nr:hypothetical protein HPB50_017809 [Hyalomma asiaticum]
MLIVASKSDEDTKANPHRLPHVPCHDGNVRGFLVYTLKKVIDCASVRTTDPEVTVALTMRDGERDRLSSGSKAAVRAFQNGCIARQVVHILISISHENSCTYVIHWFPDLVGEFEGVIGTSINPTTRLRVAALLSALAALPPDAEILLSHTIKFLNSFT